TSTGATRASSAARASGRGALGGFDQRRQQALELARVAIAEQRAQRGVVLVDLALQLFEEVEAAVGGIDEDATAVLGVGGALHQRLADHAVDQLGERRRIH